jgi:hypothetical protein
MLMRSVNPSLSGPGRLASRPLVGTAIGSRDEPIPNPYGAGSASEPGDPLAGCSREYLTGAAGQRHRTYRFLRRQSDPASWASTAELEGGPVVCITTCCLPASAAKKSISLAEHNRLVTARGTGNAPA